MLKIAVVIWFSTMATCKFEGQSPYKQKQEAPLEDYAYKKFVENANLQKDRPRETFGFALFGAGRAGTLHLPNLVRNPRIKLKYIVEDYEAKWDDLRSYWNLEGVKFLHSKNASVVYGDASIRAVVVASPSHTHKDIILNALENSKAVFCEKPITERYEMTRACLRKAKDVKQPLFAAFNRRFDPVFDNVRSRVTAGEIGRIISMKVTSKNSPLASLEYLKATGSLFSDTAVHDIDAILWTLGEYPTGVSVMARANIPEIAEIGDYDYAAITLSFPSGAIGIIDLSRYSSYGYDQRMEVFGTKGMIKAENLQPIPNVEFYSGGEVRRGPNYYAFPSRYSQAYENELERFLDVIQGQAELPIKYSDILAGCRIAAACEESARTRKFVEINWDPEELI